MGAQEQRRAASTCRSATAEPVGAARHVRERPRTVFRRGRSLLVRPTGQSQGGTKRGGENPAGRLVRDRRAPLSSRIPACLGGSERSGSQCRLPHRPLGSLAALRRGAHARTCLPSREGFFTSQLAPWQESCRLDSLRRHFSSSSPVASYRRRRPRARTAGAAMPLASGGRTMADLPLRGRRRELWGARVRDGAPLGARGLRARRELAGGASATGPRPPSPAPRPPWHRRARGAPTRFQHRRQSGGFCPFPAETSVLRTPRGEPRATARDGRERPSGGEIVRLGLTGAGRSL
jgi:hypothetical protein